MEWLELSISVPRENVAAAAEVLRRFATGGISIEEPLLDCGDQAVVDSTRPPLLKAYLPRDDRLLSRRRALRRSLSRLRLSAPLPPLRGRVVRESDWADAWKRHFRVQRVGKRIVICPSWRRCRSRAGDVVVRIDPGMAFGTGDHPSTRMCLLALQQYQRPEMRVLDLGTGSGILALAAAGLGAGEVIALDVDALAVRVAGENVAINDYAGRVEVAQGSLGREWPLSDSPAQAFDLLIANINADTIVRLASEMVRCLRAGGTGIASGIIADRANACRATLVSAGTEIVEVMSEGDWRTIVFQVR